MQLSQLLKYGQFIKNSIYIKLFLAALFWGSSAIAAKILMEEVDPSTATFLRFFVATIILFFMFRLPTKKFKLSLEQHIKLFILGITGISLCYFFYFEGLFYSSTFNASLIEATIPMITLLISIIFRKESFDQIRLIGFIIAYIGIMIILTRLDVNIILTLTFNKGDILLLLSTVCFGIYNVLYRDFNLNIKSTLQTYYIFLYGVIGLMPWLFSYYFSSGWLHDIMGISFIGIICIIVLSLCSSVLAYIFFNQGIEVLGASKASGFINYVPVITFFLTIMILGQIPTIYQIIGAIVVLSGIYISQKSKKEATTQIATEQSTF